MEQQVIPLQFIADTTGKNIHLTRLKDKTACGVFKIFLNQLDQTPNVRLNEKITFSPKIKINLKLKNGTKP